MRRGRKDGARGIEGVDWRGSSRKVRVHVRVAALAVEEASIRRLGRGGK